ncbi:sensor domain-containing diguanylate cyclase [Cohaesibacter celericrescens]|uniref:sensor domain-containing diguanylate cyclase n=1 Tax=Cohaesibacter celericrescens TaxID=2067669 RepID=UPI0035685D9F
MAYQNELERLRELEKYAILDTSSEESFDRITRIAQKIMDVPIALITLVDEKRQWFLSKQGITFDETPREISFCTHAIQKDQPFIVHDATQDERFKHNPMVNEAPNVQFYAGIPLKSALGYNLGTLCVIDTKPRDISLDEIDILRDLASIVIDEIELRTIATQDYLTGMLRRQSFMLKANQEMLRAIRYDTNFSIIAIDIDHFKSVNDRYGHATGDLVLRKIADICRSTLREIDVPARFGGEEFIILLPQTDQHDAMIVAERIRKMIEKLVVEDSGNTVTVTTSLGVVDRITCGKDDINSILNMADDRLYEAKANGRNTIVPIIGQCDSSN